MEATKLTPTISISNQKGGVRKTTVTSTLAYALGELGLKGLIIDLDPQKNLTNKFIEHYSTLSKEETVFATLNDKEPLPVHTTRFPNIDIVPAQITLMKVTTSIIGEMDARVRLKKAIAQIKENYDYILLDCPPTLDLLTINALTASDYVVIPLSHLGDETEGMADLFSIIKEVRENLNPGIKIGGIIQTMGDSTNLSTDFRKELIDQYGSAVFDAIIPKSVAAAEATQRKKLIFEYIPEKNPAKKQTVEAEYRKFAQELKIKLLTNTQ